MTTATHSCTLPHSRRRVSFLSRIMAVEALWRSRQQLASLDHARLEDLGLTSKDAAREAARGVWDVPSHWTK